MPADSVTATAILSRLITMSLIFYAPMIALWMIIAMLLLQMEFRHTFAKLLQRLQTITMIEIIKNISSRPHFGLLLWRRRIIRRI